MIFYSGATIFTVTTDIYCFGYRGRGGEREGEGEGRERGRGGEGGDTDTDYLEPCKLYPSYISCADQ